MGCILLRTTREADVDSARRGGVASTKDMSEAGTGRGAGRGVCPLSCMTVVVRPSTLSYLDNAGTDGCTSRFAGQTDTACTMGREGGKGMCREGGLGG